MFGVSLCLAKPDFSLRTIAEIESTVDSREAAWSLNSGDTFLMCIHIVREQWGMVLETQLTVNKEDFTGRVCNWFRQPYCLRNIAAACKYPINTPFYVSGSLFLPRNALVEVLGRMSKCYCL